MRTILTLGITILAFCLSFAGNSVTVDLDRIALLVPNQEDAETYSSRIAMHFTMPEVVDSTDIIYAELIIPLNFGNIDVDGNRTLEIQAHNIIENWDEEDTWNSLADDIDSTSFYTYTIKMTGETNIFMDVTKFVRPIVEANANNFGLMLIPFKHDAVVFHIPRTLLIQIEESAQLRIVYR